MIYAALALLIDIDILWMRKNVDLFSPVASRIFEPIFFKSLSPSGPKLHKSLPQLAQNGSGQIGFYICRPFSFYGLPLTADPASFDAFLTYESHNVSAQVKSQIRHLPFDQVGRVRPSGLLPSPERERPTGSNVDIILAWSRPRLMSLLTSSIIKYFVKNQILILLCVRYTPLLNIEITLDGLA